MSAGVKKTGRKRKVGDGTPGPGRPKGSTNKVTAELKDMILQALDGAGGVDYLMERAADPRTASAFLTLVGKTLPMTVKGPGANGEHIFQKIVLEIGQRRNRGTSSLFLGPPRFLCFSPVLRTRHDGGNLPLFHVAAVRVRRQHERHEVAAIKLLIDRLDAGLKAFSQ